MREAALERDVTGSRVAFLYMKLQAMLTPRRRIPRRRRRKAAAPRPRPMRRRRKGSADREDGEDGEGEAGSEEGVTKAKRKRTARAKPDAKGGRYPWLRKGRRRFLKPFVARKPRNMEEQLSYARKRRDGPTFSFLQTRKALLMLKFRRYTWNMSTAELCALGHRLIERICIVLDGQAYIASKRGDPEFRARATVAAEAELKILGDEREIARIVQKAKQEGRPARIVALEEMATRARARMQKMGLRNRWDTDAPQTWEDNDPALRAGRTVLTDPATVNRIKVQAVRENRPPQQIALEEIATRAMEAQRKLAEQEARELQGGAGDEDEGDEDELSEEDLAEMAEIEAMELQEMMQNGDPLLADLEKEFGVRRRGSKTGEWSSDSDIDASDMEALLGDDEEADEETDSDFDFDAPAASEEEPPPPPPPPPPKKRGRR